MALQGDLASFALPDVLRLLATTKKSGRLAVSGSTDHGEIWLQDGDLVGGAATSRPSANSPADVIYEVLGFEHASFVFEEQDRLTDGPSQSVDEALTIADGLQAEWDAVQAVIPSLDHVVSMSAEAPSPTVNISADAWRTIATLGSGTTVRSIVEQAGESDLVGSKRIKTLVEAGFVTVGEPRGLPADSWTEFRADDVQPSEPELEIDDPSTDEPVAEWTEEPVRLAAADGPLIVEASEDALLPEPLPGDSATYIPAQDPILVSDFGSANDGFQGPYRELPHIPEALPVDDDQALAQELAVDVPATEYGFTPADTSEPATVSRTLDDVDHPEPYSNDAPQANATFDPSGIWEDSAPSMADSPSFLGTDEEAFARVGWDSANPPVDHLSGGHNDGASDRTSLLKFLSNVKS